MTVLEPALDVKRHALWEDALALVVGSYMLSWGLFFLHAIGGVAGGLAGVAFLGSYATGWSFGLIYFVINVPFYYLAVRRLGWRFTIKTLIAVGLISVGSSLHDRFITIDSISPLYAAICAGLAIGMGMLVLFRHGASAGGFGILAAFLQEKTGIRAGVTQGSLDVAVVLASLALVEPWILACSVIGVVMLNGVIAINHRPGRYFG